MTPDTPPPTVSPSHQKYILWAGIAGGLIGALVSFALARTFPPKPAVAPPAPPSEARQFADHVIGKLRAGDRAEFTRLIRPAFAGMTNEQFAEFCQKSVFDNRDQFAKSNGGAVEIEFARETVLSPSLVRLAYADKYARGCLIWVLVVYNTPEGWQVLAFSFDSETTGFRALQ
ncbi:MAG: hypothetical protein FJ304_00330 [Planctomycetes bacterium]|nr:hypothetical protein [Planctomycetota bacterium]